MDPVVIVGSGLAGYTVARELRRRDKAVPVVLVTADGGEYYSKPALSNAFAHGRSPAQLVLNSGEEMARSLRAEVLAGTRVERIDPIARRVSWGHGGRAYSKLVLALGSRCHRLALAGDASGEVLGVNSLDDYTRLRARLEGARRVLILGAGLVGCELANDLVVGGFEVQVVEMANQVLPRLLASAEAAILAGRLEAAGVRFVLGASAARVDKDGQGYRVTLADGRCLQADLVLGATGLVPCVDLAGSAGLLTARGIVVDRWLRSSDPNVFALGDCAEVDGRWLPFTEPIRHAARALGATLAGTPTELSYPEMPVELKTPACPMVITAPSPLAA